MNILIPHSWLTEYLKTTAKPADIQKYLSLSGPSVERIYQKEGESVYDIEITTNRVDSMSVSGIAREAAVILNQFGQKSQLKDIKLPSLQSIKSEVKLPEIIDKENHCRRTMFVVLKNVKRTPTPDWMAKRLKQTDQNIHDSAIDITNYVTHAIGHPIHAFDYDKIMEMGGKIIVKTAQKGKKFETLDGETYKTVGGEIVFENPQGEIIDLPAIKGTTNSALNNKTKNILLWVENLAPEKVRFTAMTHSIRTVAAQLSEKNVDPHLAKPTLLTAIKYYQELCLAELASNVHDKFITKNPSRSIKLNLQKVTNYLGISIPTKKIESILSNLGCQIKNQENELIVIPPTFRSDLIIQVDLIEEIARIYGYHRLPSQLMATAIPLNRPTSLNFTLENKLKTFLANQGWQEVYTYSLVSAEIATQSGYELDDHLKLKNPLTVDRVWLRRSLLPSLQETIASNSLRTDLSVFELAHTYEPQSKQLPLEKLQLVLVSQKDYRTVRGVMEALLAQLYLTQLKIEPTKKAHPGFSQSATIKFGKTILGQIGQLQSGLIGVKLDMEKLVKHAQSHPNYQPIPKTMPVSEDLTFTLKPDTPVGEIITTIKNTDKLVVQVDLTSIYQQNYTFAVKYHHFDQNLTASDIEPLRQKIVEKVLSSHQAQLVGQV